MRGLHWLDAVQKEVSPTPTLGHSKVDGELFLSLCAFTYLPSHTSLGSNPSAGSSSNGQARIAPIHTVQIKTQTPKQAHRLRLTPDSHAAVLTV